MTSAASAVSRPSATERDDVLLFMLMRSIYFFALEAPGQTILGAHQRHDLRALLALHPGRRGDALDEIADLQRARLDVLARKRCRATPLDGPAHGAALAVRNLELDVRMRIAESELRHL